MAVSERIAKFDQISSLEKALRCRERVHLSSARMKVKAQWVIVTGVCYVMVYVMIGVCYAMYVCGQ